MIKAVVDSNVLISGLITPAGIPGAVLRAWRDDIFGLTTSMAILGEMERVLEYPKIKRRLAGGEAQKAEFLQLLNATTTVQIEPLDVPDLTDQDDLMFIEAALAGKVDYLVSGDSALLRLGEYGGIAIVTPRRFLAILQILPS